MKFKKKPPIYLGLINIVRRLIVKLLVKLDKFKIDPSLSLDDICLTFGTDKGYLDSKKKYQYLLKSGDKTFKKFMGRLGENMEFMNGPDYEKIRAEKSNNYKSLVKEMTKG